MTAPNRGRGYVQQNFAGSTRVTENEHARILRATAGNFIYVGVSSKLDAATSDPVWQIFRFEYLAGRVNRQVLANDDDNFDKVWDSRTTYFTPSTPTLTTAELAPPLPANAATETTLAAFKSENDANLDTANTTLASIYGSVDELETRVGPTTESAAGTDTSTSGLNGLLKRIAQRLTSLIEFFFSSTAALTQVPASTTSVTVLAASVTRKGFILVNASNKDAYVAFSATATTTAYTVVLTGGGSVLSSELPIYTGVISAIWTGTGGDMKVTAW